MVPGSGVVMSGESRRQPRFPTFGASDSATPHAWHTTWNTQRMEDDGVALVQDYFDAIERRTEKLAVVGQQHALPRVGDRQFVQMGAVDVAGEVAPGP